MPDRPPYNRAVDAAFAAWADRTLEQDEGDDAEEIIIRTVHPEKFRLIDQTTGEVWKWVDGGWEFTGLAMKADEASTAAVLAASIARTREDRRA